MQRQIKLNKKVKRGFAIAIDGPVAAGKGTIAPLLAKKLGGFYLYTGAMYRCLALNSIREKLRPLDTGLLESCIDRMRISFSSGRVIENGQDVTERIKAEDIAMLSSLLSAIPEVRKKMVPLQRKIAQKEIAAGKIVVAEGRDTATRIFPESPFKIFLTATPLIRAKRRLAQIEQRGKTNVSLPEVLADINKRDKNDSERATDPLVKNPKKAGYFVLDNSNLTEEETVNLLIGEIKNKIKSL